MHARPQGARLSLLLQRVAETLSSHGSLAHAVPGFQPRAGQTDMAMAVTQTLEQGGQLVVEAGTGVGKTYAYLVPVLLSGQRALVSTATKAITTLQVQERPMSLQFHCMIFQMR